MIESPIGLQVPESDECGLELVPKKCGSTTRTFAIMLLCCESETEGECMASVMWRLARKIGSFFLQYLDLFLLTISVEILPLVVVVFYNERLPSLFGIASIFRCMAGPTEC